MSNKVFLLYKTTVAQNYEEIKEKLVTTKSRKYLKRHKRIIFD